MKPSTHIAFLRAINVGGHVVTMERLRGFFGELGLAKVRSYIQTGNVFFETAADRAKLTSKIEGHLAKKLGYEVATFLRTVDELDALLAPKPFAKRVLTADTRHCILFLSDALPKKMELPFFSPKRELEIIGAGPREALAVLHLKKQGHTFNVAAYMEKMFQLKATARFFHTTEKILAAAKA